MWIAVFFILISNHPAVFQPWWQDFDTKHACQKLVEDEKNALILATGKDPKKIIEGECLYISDLKRV